ncbi:hypothetical protein [Kitasatospora sp. NPDC058478]|uniref:hypothetical protein n=1 Tax=unclassified Kitasatospora TaxID=2633591 RepID=UPI003653760B
MTTLAWRDQELHHLIETAADQLTAAWRTLTGAQQAVLTVVDSTGDTRRRSATLRAALAQFNAAVAGFDAAAVSITARWASTDLPRAYRHGAEAALHTARMPAWAPRPAFEWTAQHQHAAAALSAGAYAALLRRVLDTVRRARSFHRAVAETLRARGPADTSRLTAGHRLDAVVYADATRYPAAAWARAALTAQAVTAANTAAVHATAGDLNADWVQVVDGRDCGWTSHPDPEPADGTLRSVDSAAAHPIAHPGCTRGFIPRPDLTGRTDIEDGQQAEEEDQSTWH